MEDQILVGGDFSARTPHSPDFRKEGFSESDLQYIACEVVNAICPCASVLSSLCARNVVRVNIKRFAKTLGTGRAALGDTSGGGSVAAETVVDSVIMITCEASMLWKYP